MFSPLSSAGKLIADFMFRTGLASMHKFLEMMGKFDFEESEHGNPLKENLFRDTTTEIYLFDM